MIVRALAALRPEPPHGPRRARQFVARLIARHVRTQPWTGIPSAMLRRTARSYQAVVQQRTIHVTLAPQLALTVRATRPVATAAEPKSAADQVEARHKRREQETTWVERVANRHRRLDAEPSAAPRSLAVPGAELIPVRRPVEFVPPTPRILRRATASAAATGEVVEPRSAQRPHPTSPTASAPRTSALTTVEVTRLTDQVMRTLDRRLAAFRERHGRN